MTYTTIVPADVLASHLHDPDWAVFDARYDLADKSAGQKAYKGAHIPGAIYADLEEDLSSPVIPGETGRHPLPDPAVLEDRFSRWGISGGVQVVVYDDQGGAYAARMWWLLRWTGHRVAAVLDGGWSAWKAQGFPVGSDVVPRQFRQYRVKLQPELVMTSRELERRLDDPAVTILDARDRERFLGIEEPIDPVAGHIPGAVSSPYKHNLTPQGTFKPTDELREHYLRLLEGRSSEQAVVYCGSGVTAAHDVLAMETAGMHRSRLYAGSWSEWITDARRPIHVGDKRGMDV